jgi:hypothetical protein
MLIPLDIGRGPAGLSIFQESRPARGERYVAVQVSVGVVGVPLPRNPKLVDWPGCNTPLYDAFFTVAVDPLVVSVPFHDWVIGTAPG